MCIRDSSRRIPVRVPTSTSSARKRPQTGYDSGLAMIQETPIAAATAARNSVKQRKPQGWPTTHLLENANGFCAIKDT